MLLVASFLLHFRKTLVPILTDNNHMLSATVGQGHLQRKHVRGNNSRWHKS